jgi:multiple sugar transport system permease protein
MMEGPVAFMPPGLLLEGESGMRAEVDAIHKERRKRGKIGNVLTAYAFLSPWIIGFLLFSGVPIIACFALGFTKWDFINSPKWIGLRNYTEMFSAGSSFWEVMKVTSTFTVLSVAVTLLWSLLLALLLNNKIKGNGLFQFFFFVPAVMPSVALAFAFQLLYNKEIGIINYILGFFGVKDGPNWLMDSKLVVPSILFVCLYTYTTGQMMLIFNASLKEVPRELYEACAIDGGNPLQKFLYVTLSCISPVILFNLVIATINALNSSFSIIYPLTFGGPGMSSRVIGIDIYDNAFNRLRMGYASALSSVLFVIVAAVSWIQFRLSQKYVHYEN